MWVYDWSLAWFWIIVPLLMLAMMLGCLAMMVRGYRRKGCCCFGEHRHRQPFSEEPPNNGS